MAPACVKLWTRCLQDLQQLPGNNDPAAVTVIAVKVAAALAQSRELPPLSARDWRKLVVEVKVPDVLFAVYCSVVQSQGLTQLPTTITAFAALYDFLKKANNKGGFLFQTDARNGMDLSSSSSRSSSSSSSSSTNAVSLALGIRSQVLQSGLMGAFAAAMAAATDVLVRYPPQHQSAAQTSTSSTAAAGAGFSRHAMLKGQHFSQLLQSWHWVGELWPAGREQVAAIAAAAPAAMQLSVAIVQVVSRDLPAAVTAEAAEAQQSRGSEDHAGRSGAVDNAKSYACALCNAVHGVQKIITWLVYCVFVVLESGDIYMPELRSVLDIPEYKTGLATMVVLMTQALLAQQWLGPAAATTFTHNSSNRRSSTNGGGGSNNSGCGAAGSSRPLQSSSSSSTSSSSPSTVSTPSGVMSSLLSNRANQRKLELMLRNLPECTKALLDTLGMDSRAMVWAAAAHRHQARARALAAIAGALVVVIAQQPVQDERQQQQLFLIPATLLHWASNTRMKGLEEARECTAIAAGSCTSFINRLCSSFPKQSAQQQDADQLEGAAPEGLEAVTPAELKQVLPDIQKVLAVLLQHPWEPQPPSLLSTHSGIQPEAPGALARLQCRILQSAVGGPERDENWTYAAVLKIFNLGIADSSSRTALQPAGAQIVQALAAFCSMTVQTLASLESFIRTSAQQLAAGSMQLSGASLAIGAINAALFSVSLTKPGPLLSLAIAAGPGSPEQQQLYSLLSSLIKLSALGANSSEAALAVSLSFSCLITACAAIKLLEFAQDISSTTNTGTGTSASSTTIQQSTGAPEATAGSHQWNTTPLAASAVTLLPSLVLVGRCCLLWAQHLQQAVPQLLLGLSGMQQHGLTWFTTMPAAPVLILLCMQPHPHVSEPPESLPASHGLQSAFSSVSHWLTSPAFADQLAAAGHDTQQLSKLLHQLMSAHRTVSEAWASGRFSKVTAMALVQQLQVTGRALAGLAVPTMCCNPTCSNIRGPSELQLVSGAAACVAAAGRPATAAGPVRRLPGSSTSQSAVSWQQQHQQLRQEQQQSSRRSPKLQLSRCIETVWDLGGKVAAVKGCVASLRQYY